MKKIFLVLLIPLVFIIAIVFSSLQIVAPIIICLLVLGGFVSVPLILYKAIKHSRCTEHDNCPYQNNSTSH